MNKPMQCILASFFIGEVGYICADTSPLINTEIFAIKLHFIEWMLTDQKFVD